jgi:5-methylcytosine-specific restriction endonuclease McrA
MPNRSYRLNGRDIRKHKHRVFKAHGPYCFYCRGFFPYDRLTLEHLIPLCRGGDKSDDGNLALACKSCNEDKGGLTVAEYAIVLGLKPDHFSRGGRLRLNNGGLKPLQDNYQIRRIQSATTQLPLLRK